jgi:hypothetical protein
MKYEFTEGQHYIVEFLDHFVGHDEPILCQVSGWVTKDDPDYVVLTTWLVLTDDRSIEEDNREMVAIIKSTISAVIEID